MMYQRDMSGLAFLCLSLAEEAQQELDDGVEQRVDAEEEDGEHDRHDQHHDCGSDGLLARRPNDLGAFGADLTEIFAGGGFRHFASLCTLADRKRLRGPIGPAELAVT